MSHKQLKAGFGKGKIIFPKEIFPVEGFIGVHDSPCIRVMVLESNENKIVIAALEMVNVAPKGIDLCRRIIEEKTGAARERIWVHATHAISTPHEPGTIEPAKRFPLLANRDREQREMYYHALRAAVLWAAEEAAGSFGEARIGWGSGICDVNVNRDMETPYGWWNGQNPEGLSNKTMSVLRVEDLGGNPKGFFISYGIKPCAIDNAGMEGGARRISADVCGVCSRMMEEKFHVPAVFCVSAAADQVPKEQAWWEEAVGKEKTRVKDLGVEKGIEIAKRLGDVMGHDAIAIAEKIKCTKTEARICQAFVSFSWRAKDGIPKGPGAFSGEYSAEGECCVDAEIFTLGDIAFIGEKPEVNCRTELELQARSPFARTVLICMVNGGMKYMPDRMAYECNTFEAQSSMLQPGAAEHFVEVVVAELNKVVKQGE